PDPAMYPVLAAATCRLVVMHSIERDDTHAPIDAASALGSIGRFFEERLAALTAAGIARERLIIDPGMGFFLSADPAVSLAVLRALPGLRARYGLPMLVSVSRKAFLRTLTGSALPHIGPATLAAKLYPAAHVVGF